MNIFGIDLNSFGATAGAAYLIILLLAVSIGLWWGFGNLNNSTIPKTKSKKDKKK